MWVCSICHTCWGRGHGFGFRTRWVSFAGQVYDVWAIVCDVDDVASFFACKTRHSFRPVCTCACARVSEYVRVCLGFFIQWSHGAWVISTVREVLHIWSSTAYTHCHHHAHQQLFEYQMHLHTTSSRSVTAYLPLYCCVATPPFSRHRLHSCLRYHPPQPWALRVVPSPARHQVLVTAAGPTAAQTSSVCARATGKA